jgi:hypothetical protein
LLIPGLLVIPASASPTIGITVGGTPLTNWALSPGSNTNTSVKLTVTVSSDANAWSVDVMDNSDNNKPQSYAGRMVEWDPTADSGNGAYVPGNPEVLGSNLSVEGGDGPGYSRALVSALSNTGQPIENSDTDTGTATGTFSDIPITFRQTLTYLDPHLTGGHVYQIIVTFIGGVS